MKIEEINKLFTEKVAGYLSSGWIINYQSMNGWSGGELAKIDVTDGNVLLRVKLESNNGWDDAIDEWIDSVELNLYREANPDNKPLSRIVFSKWELVETSRFYLMPRSKDAWYVTDVADIYAAIEKHRARVKARRISPLHYAHEYPVTKDLLPLVRRFPKCKTVHLEDIERVTCIIGVYDRTYNFTVKGKVHSVKLSSSNGKEAC